MAAIIVDNCNRLARTPLDTVTGPGNALRALGCFITSKQLVETAAYVLSELREWEAMADSDKLACLDYRQGWVETYNLCRDWQSRKTYRKGTAINPLDWVLNEGWPMTGVKV
jgi:hypothetical protein